MVAADASPPTPRNARAEAAARLDPEAGYEVRVLEPSPPALKGDTDDPTARGVVPAEAKLVSPVSDGDVLWNDLAQGDAELAAYCAERWLGAFKPLAPIPPGLIETRTALHAVAEQVVAVARRKATGNEISLRWTLGGFGTPFFADDQQVRVEGDEIVEQCNGIPDARAPITSLRAAGELISNLIDPTGLSGEPLAIDPEAARFLGDWFGFGTLVIAELRARHGEGNEPASINLWPEHFDVATELGVEAAGLRAAYGASPGDEVHPEPYLYVAPWSAKPEGELWNATAFTGAETAYSELLGAGDQVGAGVEFLATRLAALTGH